MTVSDELEIYRKLVLIRHCQEAIIREYPSDEIKTPVHLDIGLEGISVGVTHPLPPTAKVFSSYRVHGLYLAMTRETDQYFAELYGKSTGTGGGKAGSMHLTAPEQGLITTSGIVGATVSVAVGAALANKYRGNDDVVVSVFGDSVPETGEFWESLNFACLHHLRIIFVCEDNGLAAQVPKVERQGFKTLQGAVQGFECHTPTWARGTDVVDVIERMRSVLNVMDQSPGPAVLSFSYLRFREHVGPNTDWHIGYRDEPGNPESWDPIRQYRRHLREQGVQPEALQDIEAAIDAQIEASIARAKAAQFPDASDLLRGVFA